MKSIGSISLLHIIFLSMTVIGLKNHVTIIPSLLNNAGRDAWISVILATIILIPWLFILLFIQKKLGDESIRTYLLTNYPKYGKILIYFIAFYLILIAAFTIRETLQWVSITFLLHTPTLLLLFLFVLICLFLAMSSILSITIVNVIVLFGVLVLGFMVAFVNIKVKDYTLLLPIFEHGFAPIAKSTIYPASGFVELLMFLFIQQHFKKKLKYAHLLLMLFLLLGLTLGPLIGAIVEFGPHEAAKQRYPAYEEWRIAAIGNFINHIDFFSIYQWLTGAFIRISFILFITIDILGLTGQKKQIWRTVAPAFLFCTLPLFLLNDTFFLKLKSEYFLISTFIFFFLLAFVFLFLLKRKKSSKEVEHAN